MNRDSYVRCPACGWVYVAAPAGQRACRPACRTPATAFVPIAEADLERLVPSGATIPPAAVGAAVPDGQVADRDHGG